MKLEVVTNSAAQTEAVAEKFAATLQGGEIIEFTGDLGAGKTTFSRGLLRGLHYSDDVTSPTFAIMNRYDADLTVYHFDMYRITSADGLVSTGFFDVLEEEGAVVLIEWSENIREYFGDSNISVSLGYGESPDVRKIIIEDRRNLK